MWLVIALFLVVLGLLIFLDSKKPNNYPPGPKWLPLFGSALKVLKERKRTGYLYVATAEMSRKYGPVVGLKVGKDLLVIVYGAQAMREFLLSDDLAGRPTGPFFEMRTWGKRLGIMLTDSDFWHEQRRFILKQLKEFGFGRRNMSHMIEEEAGHMISDIKSAMNNNGSLITDMDSIFGIHVLNTLWTMLAGIRYNSTDKGLKQLQGILGELFTQIDMVGAPFSHFPVLRFIAPELSGYKMYVKTHQLIWDFINKELKRHKETHNPDDPRDLMDVYINILKSPERKSTFTEDQLLAICLDMFMAGSETTNKSLGFMFLYLLKHPEVQKKAQEEIDQVVGKERLPSLGDRINMPYLESCVIETLRLFSGRAFTIPHRAMKDTHLNGYFIPKDSIVIANLHGVHMGEESGFEDPFEFRPERHMTDGKLKPVPDSFIPFGFGKHRCLGEALARANLFLLTATMLQNFDFSVPPGHKLSMECTDGVTPGPKPFKALITLRTKYVDGSSWVPKPYYYICSEHFIGDKKSDVESSPSYAPTIFPSIYKFRKNNASSATKRFERVMNRRFKKTSLSAINSESNIIATIEEITVISQRIVTEQKIDQECQVNFYADSDVNSHTFICNRFVKVNIKKLILTLKNLWIKDVALPKRSLRMKKLKWTIILFQDLYL